MKNRYWGAFFLVIGTINAYSNLVDVLAGGAGAWDGIGLMIGLLIGSFGLILIAGDE